VAASAIDELHDRLASVNDTSASLQLRDLERAMAKLEIEVREIILLVALEGMSYAEIAEVVGTPIGTVRSRLSRGRTALRQLMNTGEKTTLASRTRRGPGKPYRCLTQPGGSPPHHP
jgi:DNA-directed RNA polymerase specialized sigma24 family protein